MIGNNLKRYDFHVVEVTKPILSVSYLSEHGIETHLAREQFLKCGDGREPLIKRNGVYFVKASCVRAGDSQNHASEQEIHKNDEYEQETHKSHEESCVRAEDSQKSYVRAGDLQNSCVRAEGSQPLQESCVRAEDSQNSWKRAEASQKCVRAERLQNSQPCGSSKRDDAFVQPVVIQLTLTEFLLRQVRSQSPYHVSLPSLRK